MATTNSDVLRVFDTPANLSSDLKAGMFGYDITNDRLAVKRLADSNMLYVSDDTQQCLLSTNQTVAGVKTFSSFPITPSSAPTTDYQVSNKKYVDDQLSAADTWAEILAVGNTSGANDVIIDSGQSLLVDTNTLAVNVSGYTDKVGILTATPADILEVEAGNDNKGISISDTSNVRLKLQTDSDGSSIIDMYDNSGNNDIRFYTQNGEDNWINNGGNFGIGTASPEDLFHVSGSNGQVIAGDYGGLITRRSTANNACASIQTQKTRGTPGSETIVVDDDALGEILFRGYDGAAYKDGATIVGYVDGTPGLNDMPGRLVFSTTADGASTSTAALIIDSTQKITVNSDIIISTGSITSASGAISFGDENLSTNGALSATSRLTIGSTYLAVSPSGYTGLTGIGTVTPEGQLHVHTATAGSVTALGTANDLIVENSTDAGISILTPDNDDCRLVFGAPSDNDYAVLKANYNSGTAILSVELDGTEFVTMTNSYIGISETDPEARIHITESTGAVACLYENNGNNQVGERLHFRKRRAGAINTADELGIIRYFGHDGTDETTEGARIEIKTEGTIATDRIPGVMNFYTHPDSTGAIALAMSIDSSQTVEIENTLSCKGMISVDAAQVIQLRDSAIGLYSQADTFMDLYADGGVRVGDSSGGAPTNYTHIEADGSIELNGTATGWRDVFVDLSPLESGGTKPGFDVAGSSSIRLLSFADGETVDGMIEIPHDYKLGSDITPHIHFVPMDSPTGTDYVSWRILYFIVDEAGTITTDTTLNTGDVAVTTGFKRYDADFPTLSHATLGGQLGFKVWRVTASGDAFAGEAGVLTFGFHYEVDTPAGSRQITTK